VNLQRLLDEGLFVASSKFALLRRWLTWQSNAATIREHP